jgi:putative transposase
MAVLVFRAQGVRVSRKRVARLMQSDGLRARVRKRFRSTTVREDDQPIADNVLARQFAAAQPNQRWVGDTTEFAIGSGATLYLAAIMDLHARFIVGWALSAVNDRHLTLHALEKALKRRCPETGLLHHSDQGCTYASEDYRTRLTQRGIACSRSRRGNCYDNAVMESWFSTVKSEAGERFESFAHAKEALFDYIDVFYNQRRRHSTLGQISPRSSSGDQRRPRRQSLHRFGSSPAARDDAQATSASVQRIGALSGRRRGTHAASHRRLRSSSGAAGRVAELWAACLAAHVLFALGHARGAGTCDSGAGRPPESADDDALHAPESSGPRQRDSAAGTHGKLAKPWRHCGDGTRLKTKLLILSGLSGVSDGIRTRNFRSHSPALYP